MQTPHSRVVLCTTLIALSIGCSHQESPREVYTSMANVLVLLQTASSECKGGPVQVQLAPADGGCWIFAMPYTLKEHSSILPSSISSNDLERLFEANVSHESVLIIFVNKQGVTAFCHLEGSFRVSPPCCVVQNQITVSYLPEFASRIYTISDSATRSKTP